MNFESITPFLQDDNQEVRNDLYLVSRSQGFMEEDQGLRVPLCSATEGTLNPRSLVGEGKRISNNSFKVPLTLFKNIVLAFAAHGIPEIDSATEKKNLGSFPKLLFLCEKWRIKSRVYESWLAESRTLLQRVQSKKPALRQQLKLICLRMTKSLRSKGWKKAIKIYWGHDPRHKTKLKNCMKEVQKFRKHHQE